MSAFLIFIVSAFQDIPRESRYHEDEFTLYQSKQKTEILRLWIVRNGLGHFV